MILSSSDHASSEIIHYCLGTSWIVELYLYIDPMIYLGFNHHKNVMSEWFTLMREAWVEITIINVDLYSSFESISLTNCVSVSLIYSTFFD